MLRIRGRYLRTFQTPTRERRTGGFLKQKLQQPMAEESATMESTPCPSTKGPSLGTHIFCPPIFCSQARDKEENLKRSFMLSSCPFLLKAHLECHILKFDYCYYLRLSSQPSLTAKCQLIPRATVIVQKRQKHNVCF